jgi:acetylornithine deacetylase/succinyl-diaminopimelate desuccinylase-like protein
MIKRNCLVTILICVLIPTVYSQTTVKVISDYRSAQSRSWIDEYMKFLTLPNVYGDTAGIAKNAQFISGMLQKLGLKTELLTIDKPLSSPVVYAEAITPGATQTIIFYAHYDGQPVNPAQWANGLSPFVPVLATDRLDRGGKLIPMPPANETINPEWRIYSRSSADDKAGVFAIIKAYEAIIKSGQKAGVNIKFFFEGEEEKGSPNLGAIFLKYKEKLKSDLWIICDGPRHQSGKKQIVFGVRGDVNIGLTVYGAKRPLHSGNYGNWAPNPAMRLAQLLASMKDKSGMVTIKGFYDDVTPLSELEKQALRKVPDVEQMLKEELGIIQPDGNGKPFLELLNLPTLNINGMQSANIGDQAANVIPTTASAVLDLRLVSGNDVDRQTEKLANHIREQGYYITSKDPTDEERKKYPLIAKFIPSGNGYNAQRTPMDLPIAGKIIKAVQATTTDELVLLPTLGGSLPLFLFEKHLGAKPITITVVNYDNNQHAENENVIIRYIWEGVETMAAIMMMK